MLDRWKTWEPAEQHDLEAVSGITPGHVAKFWRLPRIEHADRMDPSEPAAVGFFTPVQGSSSIRLRHNTKRSSACDNPLRTLPDAANPLDRNPR